MDATNTPNHVSRGERAYLVLADGTIFEGEAFGARGTTTGEAVFTTTMTGYQEVLTDPSYAGQLVVMTAPEIGNVGVNAADAESVDGKPHVAGFILRDSSPVASNWRSEQTLEAYLVEHGIVAISGVDTRRLTRHLRDNGSQNAAIGTASPEELLKLAKDAPDMSGLDLVQRVTPKAPYTFNEGRGAWRIAAPGEAPREPSHHVVAIDYGVKKNILRCLVDAGFRVTVVPASMSAEDILALNPDGIFLSNGPGDPAAVGYAVETIRALLGKKPMFGICLGHQLTAIALGGKTYKLKFGHRGANQPVKDLATGRIEITTQNHGFCVDLNSLPAGVESTHIHLNDGTSEGLSHKDLKVFTVQYHPEAAAGPHDSLYLFDRFKSMMQ
ncbi:Carbamoyl-phosphate synthase small chain [Labilithrix luteola]|uniref:Carbamoyl phosphate synthase small chain n=1 Tax=Labilithrix luteola TaxID=1391654 RepID=A0A0K1Q8V3_9BACT|nr:glutamine-hydrolyzing carbamoyl-phosphate synthase small subunit [Labilithrix luteola]AKV02168.1 Carbamoyl-phosphate synthase small chain [Labilithrix luteola]